MWGQPGSDEWLMQGVAEGRREYVATLLRRYANPLLTFIQRMIGDPHRAEELFQDVFLAVWTHRKSYDVGRPFRPWLFGIAINKCRADFRKPVPAPVLDEAPAEVLVAAGPTPAEAAIAAETARLVAAAVGRLPTAQRTVLVLRIWNGLSYAEIARTLNLAEGTVRSHMFHALAAVRKHLEPRMKAF